MSFFAPATPEHIKFSYNTMTVVMLILTATLWQLTGAFIPFIVAVLFAIFIIWQLYARVIFIREDDVSEDDKNRIAFHEMMTGDIGRIRTAAERAIQRVNEVEAKLTEALNKKKLE